MNNNYQPSIVVGGMVLVIAVVVIVGLYINSGTRDSRVAWCNTEYGQRLAVLQTLHEVVDQYPEWTEQQRCDEVYRRHNLTLPWLP